MPRSFSNGEDTNRSSCLRHHRRPCCSFVMALCVPPLPKNLKANIIAGVPLEYGSIVVEALLAADFPVDRCGLCCLCGGPSHTRAADEGMCYSFRDKIMSKIDWFYLDTATRPRVGSGHGVVVVVIDAATQTHSRSHFDTRTYRPHQPSQPHHTFAQSLGYVRKSKRLNWWSHRTCDEESPIR